MKGDTTHGLRAVLLAALMVLSVVAVANPASAAVVTADRSLSSTSVAPGGSVTVTLTAEFDEDKSGVSILDGYSGPADSASIDSITVGGSEVSDPVFSDIGGGSLTVAVEDVPANTEIQVTYTVQVSSDAADSSSVSFTGSADNPDVGAGGDTANFGTDFATVSTGVSDSDADGIPDVDDDCPATPGTAPDGCPEEPGDGPREITPGGTYWIGQELTTDIFTAAETVELHYDNADGDTFVTEKSSAGGTVTVVPSDFDEFGAGDYSLRSVTTDTRINFTAREQRYNAEVDPATVNDEGDDTTTDITVT
jgi:surface glycoprotein (TIGR04207 family)